LKTQLTSTQQKAERAFLIGVAYKSAEDPWPIKSSIEELAALTETAGAKPVGNMTQKLDFPSSTLYFGKGKLEELIEKKTDVHFDVVIVNDELTPRQQRNLEDALKIKVIDRTALILDIFAKSAHTREGQLQVELAQHQYLLPRLAGQWSHLERLGGGIGTRGPGESQLETDRRLIRQRIKKLQLQIEDIRKHRTLYRTKRKRSFIPVVALVGYTNAGKSTLLNALSKADVLVENRPFSTLDPVTRKVSLASGKEILLTDTVGFIHKLPPTIVAAFRATLEEITESDLILHVVDITHPNAMEQFQTVERILGDLDVSDKPRITVLNKMDVSVRQKEDLEELSISIKVPDENIISISAQKGWGFDVLIKKIENHFSSVA
jgi:GTPase